MPNSWFSLRRAFDFRGRASRREYFLFHLLAFVGLLLPVLASGLVAEPAGSDGSGAGGVISSLLTVLWGVWIIALLVALLAVGVRRVHDQDKPGVYLLLGLVPLVGWIISLVLIFTPGDEQANRFGPNPRYPFDESADLAQVFS